MKMRLSLPLLLVSFAAAPLVAEAATIVINNGPQQQPIARKPNRYNIANPYSGQDAFEVRRQQKEALNDYLKSLEDQLEEEHKPPPEPGLTRKDLEEILDEKLGKKKPPEDAATVKAGPSPFGKIGGLGGVGGIGNIGANEPDAEDGEVVMQQDFVPAQ